MHTEPAVLSPSAPTVGEHLQECVLVDGVVTLAQSFGAVLVGGSETIVRLAAQPHEPVTGPLDLEQIRCPLVVRLTRFTAPTDDRRVDSARTLSDVRRNIRTATIRIDVGNIVLVVPGEIGGICIHLAVSKKRTLHVPVDKVVIKLQHAHYGVLQNEEPHVYGHGVRDGFLVHRYLVRIVDDDVELSEPSIVNHERCRLLRVVFHVAMSIHIGDCLPVTRVSQQLYGVCDDGLVRVDVSLASCRGHGVAEPPEARDGGVLDDLIDARQLQSLFQVPSRERRGEQYLVAVETAHEHAMRIRHDVVFFGVSEKCACNVIGAETSHSINPNMVPSRTPLRICCDVIVHRTWRRRGKAASRHLFTTRSLLFSFHSHSHNSTTLTK